MSRGTEASAARDVVADEERAKTLTFYLACPPYAGQGTQTTLSLAGEILARGGRVNVFASGDGVYNFVKGQGARGVPNAEEGFVELMGRGAAVYL